MFGNLPDADVKKQMKIEDILIWIKHSRSHFGSNIGFRHKRLIYIQVSSNSRKTHEYQQEA